MYIAVLRRLRSELDPQEVDLTQQLAMERAFQASIEACLDIASHVVSTYQLGSPVESRDVFRFLADAGYLDADFGKAMVALVGLRNRLVHLYWDIDIEKLYSYLQEDVESLERFRDFGIQLLAAEADSQAEQ